MLQTKCTKHSKSVTDSPPKRNMEILEFKTSRFVKSCILSHEWNPGILFQVRHNAVRYLGVLRHLCGVVVELVVNGKVHLHKDLSCFSVLYWLGLSVLSSFKKLEQSNINFITTWDTKLGLKGFWRKLLGNGSSISNRNLIKTIKPEVMTLVLSFNE